MTRLVLGTVVVFIWCVPQPAHAQSRADWQLELGGVYSIQPSVSAETLRSYRFDQGVEGRGAGVPASEEPGCGAEPHRKLSRVGIGTEKRDRRPKRERPGTVQCINARTCAPATKRVGGQG